VGRRPLLCLEFSEGLAQGGARDIEPGRQIALRRQALAGAQHPAQDQGLDLTHDRSGDLLGRDLAEGHGESGVIGQTI
jgi:hypothetical protein